MPVLQRGVHQRRGRSLRVSVACLSQHRCIRNKRGVTRTCSQVDAWSTRASSGHEVMKLVLPCNRRKPWYGQVFLSFMCRVRVAKRRCGRACGGRGGEDLEAVLGEQPPPGVMAKLAMHWPSMPVMDSAAASAASSMSGTHNPVGPSNAHAGSGSAASPAWVRGR